MPKPKQRYYKRKYQPKQMKSCNIRSVYGFAETFLADIYSGYCVEIKGVGHVSSNTDKLNLLQN